MGELHDHLDREARRVSGDREAFDRIIGRARRRRTARRVAGGALALAIAGAGLGVAYGAFRGPDTAQPAVGPSPSATSSARVRLLDGADDPEAMEIARGVIGMAGFQVVEEGPAGHPYETTTIACPLEFDEEAARIAERLGVEAAIVAGIPNPEYDLTVYIGEDFATFEHEHLTAFVDDFIDARQDGDAEMYLGSSARDDYFETSGRTEPRSGELYLYPEQGIARFRIQGWDKLDVDTWRFELRLSLNAGCQRVVMERIRIEVLGGSRYELESANLAGVILIPGCGA
jgi:hypothetical protein